MIFLLSSGSSFAQEKEPTPTPKEKVDYQLPYPGLLPDSSIYSLRMLRDKIVSFLISDPLKKAEFNLLQADKRLNAGIYLFNKGKVDLAVSTVSKAENYFESAVQKAKEAKNQGMDTKQISTQLMNSVKKHQEELDALSKKSKDNFREDFLRELRRSKDFEKEIKLRN